VVGKKIGSGEVNAVQATTTIPPEKSTGRYSRVEPRTKDDSTPPSELARIALQKKKTVVTQPSKRQHHLYIREIREQIRDERTSAIAPHHREHREREEEEASGIREVLAENDITPNKTDK
jgi:hypothetical protein